MRWKLGRGCAPFGEGELVPHLTQCGQGRGLPTCRVSSWSVQPFGHSTPTSQTDRETGQDRQDRTTVRFTNGRPTKCGAATPTLTSFLFNFSLFRKIRKCASQCAAAKFVGRVLSNSLRALESGSDYTNVLQELTRWDGRPCQSKVGRKVGSRAAVPVSVGDLGSHLTQCRLGQGLPPYQVAS